MAGSLYGIGGDHINKTTMSVPEMRRMLGLGKTDSYWLVHQGFFKTILVNGKMRVVIESFEYWYARQFKHRKVTGEEPGSKLREETFSAREIADMLGISKQQANILVRQAQLPFTKVHNQFQIPKDAFVKWYASQSHYVRKQEKAAALDGNYLSLPQMGRKLGRDRRFANSIIRSRSGQRMLETVRVGSHWYVEAGSFKRWLNNQTKYRLVAVPKRLIQLRRPKNPAYYTVEEVCRFYGLRHSELYEKLASGDIPAIRTGKSWRIKRNEFDDLMTGRREE